MSANAAAALAYRAREKLRQAYLQAHLLASPHPECEPHRSRLGAYVRGGLSKRDQAATKRHVDNCASCQALVAELSDVNRMLVRSVLPLFPSVAPGRWQWWGRPVRLGVPPPVPREAGAARADGVACANWPRRWAASLRPPR
jgi:anti-sigma factor RsiW